MKGNNAFSKALNWLYQKLFRINDTPQKIAVGLGLGVFAGIFPGTGPAAALFLAILFRANRASALLGSILTNTWLSLITFLLSVKLGALIFGVRWQDIRSSWASLIKDFSLPNFFSLSSLKIILPVLCGFILLSLFFGLMAYLLTLAAIKIKGSRKREA